MEKDWIEQILILAKTYPSPSAQYAETSCIAGINRDGQMRRLYPVPFRLLQDNQKFKKWQWIEARVEKSSNDLRPESHKLYVDTITCIGEVKPQKGWADRMVWLDRIPSFDCFDDIAKATETEHSLSLALLRPKAVLRLEITPARNPEWTPEEREKLLREQLQGSLFSEDDGRRRLKELRKMPFDFYYHYVCDTPDGEKPYRHKIIDWEACMLFWNCKQSHGSGWEKPFRDKLEREFGSKELMFLMGNQHRFQYQWLIISLIYPPKRQAASPSASAQGTLF